MDEKSLDKLGFKGRMLIFTALEKTYGRDTAFDVATKSDDHLLKHVAIAAADEQAAQTLLHDLATLRDKKDGTPAHNALRWQRRVIARWIRPATARQRPTPRKHAHWSASDAQAAGALAQARKSPPDSYSRQTWLAAAVRAALA
jgi:hypothetical protein